jgi:hypothetical protein
MRCGWIGVLGLMWALMGSGGAWAQDGGGSQARDAVASDSGNAAPADGAARVCH